MVLAISYALNSQKLLKQSTSQVNGVRELDSSCIRTDSRESTNKQSTYTIDDDVELFATPSQKRLAEITEMIHTASLFHDDVIDKV